MILVDTSVWVEHFRSGNAALAAQLTAGRVLTHPFVIGELACGGLTRRHDTLRLLGRLPTVPAATDTEVLAFIEQHALMGRGIGLIDVHLLASTALAAPARLWTHDKRLAAIATVLQLAHV